jgi:hypothetical protein
MIRRGSFLGGSGGSSSYSGAAFFSATGSLTASGFDSTSPPPSAPTTAAVSNRFAFPITRILVRNAAGARVAELDDYIDLTYIMRHQGVGTWALNLHPDSPALDFITTPSNGVAGIEIIRNGVLVFSGPWTKRRRTRQGETNRVAISGVDDSVWLRYREAIPPTGQAYDIRGPGVTSTVMRAYVNAHLGPGATVARKLTNLTLAPDPLAGTTVTGQGRYPDTILDVLVSLAVAGGDLGFGILSDGAGGLVFSTYAPTDRTATAKFSNELGNLGDFDYELDAPEANYVIGGGSGEGTARVIVEAGDTSSITSWGRIEGFRDRRDTADTTLIDQTLTEELANKAEKRAATITPIDTPYLAFGTHYFLGDKVSAILDGVTFTEVIREAKITVQPSGRELVEPTLATPGNTGPGIPDIFRAPGRISGRVVTLERT